MSSSPPTLPRPLTTPRGERVRPAHDAWPRSLVLDLSGVDVLTSGGLSELVALHERLRDMDGELVLDNVGERAFAVLSVAHLTEVISVRRQEARGADLLPLKA